MMDAMTQSILVPIDIAAVLTGLAAGDPSCETCSAFVRHDLLPSPLRPSIETTLHAVMPQRVVVHVHCVETIAQACLSDASERLTAPLAGLDWAFVPYVRRAYRWRGQWPSFCAARPMSWCSESMAW